MVFKRESSDECSRCMNLTQDHNAGDELAVLFQRLQTSIAVFRSFGAKWLKTFSSISPGSISLINGRLFSFCFFPACVELSSDFLFQHFVRSIFQNLLKLTDFCLNPTVHYITIVKLQHQDVAIAPLSGVCVAPKRCLISFLHMCRVFI